MKKTIIPVLLLLALLISACNSGGEGAPAEAPVDAEEDADAGSESQPQGGEAVPPTDIELPTEENPCVPFSILDRSFVNPYPNLPPVTDADWSIGPADAAATFMEYSEPQCPFCAQLEPLMTAIYNLYPDDVRLVYRHRPFPESFHDKSLLASQALEAAGEQGYFQELKNFLFERQSKNPEDPNEANIPDSEFWAGVAPNDFDEWLAERVPDLGIDADQFLLDMYKETTVEKIKQAQVDADALEIRGTPTLFLNGYPYEDERRIDILSVYVKLLRTRDMEFGVCPSEKDEIDENKTYSALIETTKGDIKVELYPQEAFYTVNSFVYLARRNWFDDLPIISIEDLILSGDPSDTGYGGSGYIYLTETNESRSLSEPGFLSVYRFRPDISGSPFFINKVPMEDLPGVTIFGRVIEGMDVVNALEPRFNILEDPLDSVISVKITEE